MKTIRNISIFLFISFIVAGCEKDNEGTNAAPATFTVSATPSGNNATIQWTEAKDPDGDTVTYSVQLDGTMVLSNSALLQYTTDALDYETSYSGKVIASDPEGLTSEKAFNFTTGDTPNTAPSIVVLQSPSTGSTDILVQPELSWDAASDPDGDALTYDVYLDLNTSPTTKIGDAITTTSYEVLSSLEFNTIYYWKVVANDGNGGMSESDINSFTTKYNEAPTNFSLAEIENAATGVELLPSFAWEASTDPEGGTITYDLYIDASSNPTSKVAENLSNTSYQTTVELSSNTKYYWKVIAKDPQGTETLSAIWSFTTRDLVVATQVVADAPWAGRDGHTSLVFDNKMWIIGGLSCCGGRYNDVWYSEDGETWVEATSNAGFSPRGAHSSVVFDNKMWVFGGNESFSSGREFSDVWYSEDGVTWVEATSDADFGPRFNQKSLVFDGKIWMFGGNDADNSYSNRQIWNSTDGISWNLIADVAGAYFHTSQFSVFNGKIWRIGNFIDTNIYSSTNGVDWSLESANAPFGQRLYHTTTVWDNKIWLFGGSDYATNQFTELSDAWYSEDGITWNLAANDAGYTPVASATSLTFNDKIWILGGGTGYQGYVVYNQVWSLQY